jgi:hypothetical protein
MRTMLLKLVKTVLLILLIIFVVPSVRVAAQNISFGIFADPVISWFSTNTKEIQNNGARAGFNFGFTFNKYFSPNYAFSTGLNIMNTGGRLVSTDTTDMKFNNQFAKVLPGKPVLYKIQYLIIPIGLKFKSNQIGYMTFFSDIGIDPKVVIGGKADIPSLNIKGEDAMNELRALNLSYHFMGGIEYSLGGSSAIVIGLGYENNFLDVTKDINKQPIDKVTQNILKFRIGINF